jgi:hypothetical protein
LRDVGPAVVADQRTEPVSRSLPIVHGMQVRSLRLGIAPFLRQSAHGRRGQPWRGSRPLKEGVGRSGSSVNLIELDGWLFTTRQEPGRPSRDWFQGSADGTADSVQA